MGCEIAGDNIKAASARGAAHIGIVLPANLLLGKIGNKVGVVAGNHVLRFEAAVGPKSQQVPPNWLFTVVFQLYPLTFRQSKLSAERGRADENTPTAKSANTKKVR